MPLTQMTGTVAIASAPNMPPIHHNRSAGSRAVIALCRDSPLIVGKHSPDALAAGIGEVRPAEVRMYYLVFVSLALPRLIVALCVSRHKDLKNLTPSLQVDVRNLVGRGSSTRATAKSERGGITPARSSNDT
jgi:hypothetical protein